MWSGVMVNSKNEKSSCGIRVSAFGFDIDPEKRLAFSVNAAWYYGIIIWMSDPS